MDEVCKPSGHLDELDRELVRYWIEELVLPARKGLGAAYEGQGRQGSFEELGPDDKVSFAESLVREGARDAVGPRIRANDGTPCEAFAYAGDEEWVREETTTFLLLGLKDPQNLRALKNLFPGGFLGQLFRLEIDGLIKRKDLEGIETRISEAQMYPAEVFDSLVEAVTTGLGNFMRKTCATDGEGLESAMMLHDFSLIPQGCRKLEDELESSIGDFLGKCPVKGRLDPTGFAKDLRPEYVAFLAVEEIAAAWPTVSRSDALRWVVANEPIVVPDLRATLVGPREMRLVWHRTFQYPKRQYQKAGILDWLHEAAMAHDVCELDGETYEYQDFESGGYESVETVDYEFKAGGAPAGHEVREQEKRAVSMAFADTLSTLVMDDVWPDRDREATNSYLDANSSYVPPIDEGWERGLRFCLYRTATRLLDASDNCPCVMSGGNLKSWDEMTEWMEDENRKIKSWIKSYKKLEIDAARFRYRLMAYGTDGKPLDVG